MEKLFLINNPEVFQGEKYLEGSKNYFEGWYFKITGDKGAIAFIPGISISKNEKKAFVQVITDEESYFVDYGIENFKFSNKPFYVKIGDNYFAKDRIQIDIKDDEQKIRVYGEVKFTDSKNIDSSWISPNIMGPFAFVPNMECNHAILSMRNRAWGKIEINRKKFKFNEGIGYIEKDWGCSFPKSYIWCQGNNFRDSNGAFMLSIADIPFGLVKFRGLICSLMVDGKEYRFATYNGAKIVRYEVSNNRLSVGLKKGHYYLEVEVDYKGGLRLSAPVKGKMEKDIIESIGEVIRVTLREDDRVIFDGTSDNCGLEVVLK